MRYAILFLPLLLTMFYHFCNIQPQPRKPAPQPRRPPPMPTVEGAKGGQLDVVSRLLKDRILLLGTEVNDEVANVLVAQLLYLANDDPEKEITLYINSPGGSVSAGLAIYDTMKFIPCDVQTVCFGMAASMGAFLLGAGTPGKRKSLPNARVMIHQPLGGARGQAADIEIQAKEILFTKALLNKYIADYTGQPVEKIEEDCDRDFFMTPYEAKDYGIIDEGTFFVAFSGLHA
jgi:ATP-dependent Clp protease, protease subunit